MTEMGWTLLGVGLLSVVLTVNAQSMDPRVNITSTDPESDGAKVRGFIAKDVTLTCYVENLPDDLTVRWQRTMYDKYGRETTQLISDDMAVEDNMKWSIEKPTQYSWRLRIKALALNDEGNYTCFVRLTGNNNRAESNRTVFAYDPPTILESESSSDMYAKEGDYVHLRCNASGRPQPTIMWRREGNAILPDGGVVRLGSDLKIYDLQYDARGRYICDSMNEVGYAKRDILLSIQYSPKVFADPEETYQAIGYQRTLICHIEANPMASTDPETNQLRWYKDQVIFVPDDRRYTRTLEGAYGRLTYEMVIRKVESDDYGEYTCEARSNIGTGSAEVTLIETDEPQEDKRGIVSRAVATSSTMTVIVLAVCFPLLYLR